jgi:excinuclease ABC subunit B
VDDIIDQVQKRAQQNERTLITTLTKKMAEDLAFYLEEMNLRVKYLHSEVKTIERVKILKELRERKFDCLVGVNLLREGLDLPEVSLVCILDADKEGFLRSCNSLIQVAGRCARHVNAEVIMYADTITRSMQAAIDETERRRKIQIEYNKKHNITPTSIEKSIQEGIEIHQQAQGTAESIVAESEDEYIKQEVLSELEEKMYTYARNLQFEKAAKLKNEVDKLKKELQRNSRGK